MASDDDLCAIRQRLDELAKAAIPATAKVPRRREVAITPRNSTILARLAAASVVLLLMCTGALLWLTRGDEASIVATARTNAPTSLPEPTTSTAQNPTSTPPSTAQSAAPPDADESAHFVFDHPELDLSFVPPDLFGDTYEFIVVLDDAERPTRVATIHRLPDDSEIQQLGIPVDIAIGVRGWGFPDGEGGPIANLSWMADGVVFQMNAKGFDDASVVELAGTVVPDNKAPGGLTVEPVVGLSSSLAAGGGGWSSMSIYCDPRGTNASIVYRSGSAVSPTAWIATARGELIHVETELGTFAAAIDSGSIQAALALGGNRSLIVSVLANGPSLDDPVQYLHRLALIDDSSWEMMSSSLDSTFGGCEDRSNEDRLDEEAQPTPFVLGTLDQLGDPIVAHCDSAALADDVPASVGEATSAQPMFDLADEAVDAFAKTWEPRGRDHWPSQMPDGGWWTVELNADSRAYAWAGADATEPISEAHIVVFVELFEQGWQVVAWQASGC
ncbi:MAG: hypothetical protein GY708_06520 [Actinomycetia bacterium]|nr:hypothetical protein [Actinomycetes bacterium]